MANPYLLLWFEAPLQSWGHDSKFGRRDTLSFPTRSGVLGLICCARGAGDEQVEWLASWEELSMQVDAYVRNDPAGNPSPLPTLLSDFHMVGSGYDDKDPWQSLLIPKTNEGKKAVGGGTKLTYRYYIQDMAYGVVLEATPSLADEIEAALVNPVWDIYLGRKCCVPTELILQGRYNNLDEACEASRTLAADKQRGTAFTVVEGEHEGEVLTLNDVPVQFGTKKRYKDRRVTVLSLHD